MMIKIEAIVREEVFEDVKEALNAIIKKKKKKNKKKKQKTAEDQI